MPSWDEPNNSAPAHVDVLENIRDRDTYALTWTQAGGTWTDIPLGAMQWNNSSKVIARFNGSTFETQAIGIAGGGTGATTAAGARTNLDVYGKSETLEAGTGAGQARTNAQNDGRFLHSSENLQEIEDAGSSAQAEARKNIGVSGAAYSAGSLVKLYKNADEETESVLSSLSFGDTSKSWVSDGNGVVSISIDLRTDDPGSEGRARIRVNGTTVETLTGTSGDSYSTITTTINVSYSDHLTVQVGASNLSLWTITAFCRNFEITANY